MTGTGTSKTCFPVLGFWDRYSKTMKPLEFQPANFKESGDLLKNPCCGFYRVLVYTPAEDGNVQGWIAEFLNPQADSLLLLEINLKNYVKRSKSPSDREREPHTEDDLSPEALEQIDTLFAVAEKNHTDLIVRFLYDTDGTPEKTEPEDIELVRRHIKELAEIVNRHKACIYILQGCLTGAYGEMHDGRFSTPAVQKELISLLAESIDPSIYLAVRTPALQRLCTESPLSVTRENAFSGSLSARLGLFNDGLFGSETDLGTYGTAATAAVPPTDMQAEDHWKYAGNRTAELAFQDHLCAYVPNGGEAVAVNAYSAYPACIKDFIHMQVSYLNADYSPDVMALWKDRSCVRAAQLLSAPVFDGRPVYTYIASRLGYRYIVTSAKMEWIPSREAEPGCRKGYHIIFRISIENRGFAPAYRKFETRLLLLSRRDGQEASSSVLPHAGQAVPPGKTEKDSAVSSYDISFDNRFLSGNGGKAELICTVPVDDLPADPLEVRLFMKDPVSGKTIRFANKAQVAADTVFLGTLA